MLETRTFENGMNGDAAPELMPKGQYGYSLNHDLMNDRLLHSAYGNTEITSYDIALPAGTNKVIGSKEYPEENAVYYFVYNSNDEHRILRYNRNAATVTTIMEEQSPAVLNFTEFGLIHSIDIVQLEDGETLLYWTDNVNPPRKINVKRALGHLNGTQFTDNFFYNGYVGFETNTGTMPFVVGDKVKIQQVSGATNQYYNSYATVINKPATNRIVVDITFGQNTPPEGGYIYYDYAYIFVNEQAIDAVKWQPENSPVAQLISDTSYAGNNIRKNFFQFATRYVYDDNERSAHSPYSNVPLPVGISSISPTSYVQYQNTQNAIDVTFNTGAPNIKAVELLVRTKSSTAGIEFNNDTYLYKSFDKKELRMLDNVSYTYRFYNDIAPVAITPTEQNLLADRLPRYAGCQVVTEDLRMLYGDCTIDFDLVEPDVTLTAIKNTPPQSLAPQNLLVTVPTPPLGGSLNHFKLPSSPPSVGGVIVMKTTYGDTINYTITPNDTINYPTNLKNSLIDLLWSWGYFTSLTVYDNIHINLLTAGPPPPGQTGTLSFNWTSPVSLIGTSLTFDKFASPREGTMVYLTANSQLISTKNIYYTTTDPYALFIIALGVKQGINVLLDADLVYPNQNSAKSISALKKGALHPIGLVYYDRAGRLSSVIDCGRIKTEFVGTNNQPFYYTGSVEINHTPPDWAERYQVVIGKNRTYKKFTNITITQVQQNTNDTDLILGTSPSAETYSFTPGDRCRFVAASSTSYFTTYVDLAVLAYNDATRELTVENILATPISGQIKPGTLIEIYTPQQAQAANFYWEIQKEFPIINAGQSNRYHGGQLQNQTATQPAIVALDSGDVYFRQRLMQNTTTTTNVYYIESSNFTDFYESSVTNIGRANLIVPGFKEQRYVTQIRYSQRAILNSFINGLSTFFDETFEEYSLSYGAIKRLSTRDRFVRVFQQFKTGAVPLNQTIQATTAGAVTIQTDSVLNPIQYYNGNFGIFNNPESLVTYGFSDFFVDVNNGVLCQVSNDGLKAISVEYDMNTFITDDFKDIRDTVVNTSIFGVYDKKKRLWIVSSEDKVLIKPNNQTQSYSGFTLSFKDTRNAFSSFYSYRPENMCSIGMDFVTFKDGKVYLHDATASAANYYGTQYAKKLHVTFNESPLVEKNQKALLEEVNELYTLEGIENLRGQDTYLTSPNFELKGTGYCAALWKDINTPNITNPLFEGNEIKGFVMTAKMINETANPTRIVTFGCEQIPVLRSGF